MAGLIVGRFAGPSCPSLDHESRLLLGILSLFGVGLFVGRPGLVVGKLDTLAAAGEIVGCNVGDHVGERVGVMVLHKRRGNVREEYKNTMSDLLEKMRHDRTTQIIEKSNVRSQNTYGIIVGETVL